MNFLAFGVYLRCLVFGGQEWKPPKGDMRLGDQETKLQWNNYAEFGSSLPAIADEFSQQR